MIITETGIKGALVIAPERFNDERGFFARAWSQREFSDLGAEADFIEGNLSYNERRGTLRGMHYQAAPHRQAKLVRCTRGSIYDVGVDLREDSETFRQWVGVELSAENRIMLYLPGNFGHGYLTLADATEVHYQVTEAWAPEFARGFRWDDPAFNIQWPKVDELIINKRDLEYPDFKL
ncbi:MAG: dTDP-4-dehydrorhamnose 3,5-epimerase [Pyrinomonadaceae bacterium]